MSGKRVVLENLIRIARHPADRSFPDLTNHWPFTICTSLLGALGSRGEVCDLRSANGRAANLTSSGKAVPSEGIAKKPSPDRLPICAMRNGLAVAVLRREFAVHV